MQQPNDETFSHLYFIHRQRHRSDHYFISPPCPPMKTFIIRSCMSWRITIFTPAASIFPCQYFFRTRPLVRLCLRVLCGSLHSASGSYSRRSCFRLISCCKAQSSWTAQPSRVRRYQGLPGMSHLCVILLKAAFFCTSGTRISHRVLWNF